MSAIQLDHTWTFNYPSGATYAIGIDTGYEFSYTNQAFSNMNVIYLLRGAFSISLKFSFMVRQNNHDVKKINWRE